MSSGTSFQGWIRLLFLREGHSHIHDADTHQFPIHRHKQSFQDLYFQSFLCTPLPFLDPVFCNGLSFFSRDFISFQCFADCLITTSEFFCHFLFCCIRMSFYIGLQLFRIDFFVCSVQRFVIQIPCFFFPLFSFGYCTFSYSEHFRCFDYCVSCLMICYRCFPQIYTFTHASIIAHSLFSISSGGTIYRNIAVLLSLKFRSAI